MMQEDLQNRIVAFAKHLVGPSDDPAEKARSRAWLDARGLPTAEGRLLLEALGDQAKTRTAFRVLP
ncbi:MAG: hypothetical protein NXH82_16365 [Rhodobacteraceae bacterium]|nr:hypothetical protein [Paracoccaceae bacterium]